MSIPKAQIQADVMVVLGVTPEQVAAQPLITPILKRAKLHGQVMEYLVGSPDPDAKRFLEGYAKLGAEQRKAVSLEIMAVAADLTTERLFELIAGAVFVQAKYEGALLAAAAHPKVVAKTIERALEDPVELPQPDGSVTVAAAQDGGADRKVLHQHAGFLPTPKTQFVNLPGVKTIDARQQTQNVTVLPPVESSVKRMADRFGEKLIEAPPEGAEPDEGDEVDE